MRSEELWCSLAAVGWFATFVGCHAPGSELESVRYGPAEDRIDTFTIANINLTYEDEHGRVYTEISEVSCVKYDLFVVELTSNIVTNWFYGFNHKRPVAMLNIPALCTYTQ